MNVVYGVLLFFAAIVVGGLGLFFITDREASSQGFGWFLGPLFRTQFGIGVVVVVFALGLLGFRLIMR